MPAFLVAAWKTSMKALPMILRFFSGSVTPLSLRRKSSVASSYWSLILKFRPKTSCTTSASRARSRPLFTKMQVSWSPMALCSNAAATLESTPPLRPRITFSLPTCLRMASTASSR